MALTDNLVSFWKFDESSGNAADSVGSNTLVNNGSATFVSGLINNAAHLVRASSQYFKVSSNLGIAGNGDITISMWVKFTASASSPFNFVFDFRSTSGADKRLGLLYFYNGGSPKLEVDNAEGYIDYNADPGTINYHHILVTRSSSGVAELWVDGVSIGTASQTGGGGASDNAFYVGAQSGGGNTNDANYDAVGVWSRVLSSTEITALYNGGVGSQYPFLTSSIKTINGLAKASVKTVNGLAIASVKAWLGLA